MGIIRRLIGKEKTVTLKPSTGILVALQDLPTRYIAQMNFQGSSRPPAIPVLLMPPRSIKLNLKNYYISVARMEAVTVVFHNAPIETHHQDDESSEFALMIFSLANPDVRNIIAQHFPQKILNCCVLQLTGSSPLDFESQVRNEASTAFPGLSAFIQSYRSTLSVTQLCWSNPVEIRVITFFKPDASVKTKIVEIKNGSSLKPLLGN